MVLRWLVRCMRMMMLRWLWRSMLDVVWLSLLVDLAMRTCMVLGQLYCCDRTVVMRFIRIVHWDVKQWLKVLVLTGFL